MNFLRRLALQEKKKLNDSSRFEVVEIARVPDMLPSLYLTTGIQVCDLGKMRLSPDLTEGGLNSYVSRDCL